jgi:hypothetical protein
MVKLGINLTAKELNAYLTYAKGLDYDTDAELTNIGNLERVNVSGIGYRFVVEFDIRDDKAPETITKLYKTLGRAD